MDLKKEVKLLLDNSKLTEEQLKIALEKLMEQFKLKQFKK